MELDPDVMRYLTLGQENQKKFFQNYLSGTKLSLPTVTVTPKDLPLEKMNFKDAKDIVTKKIATLKGPSFAFYSMNAKSCKTKDELLLLYRAVQETIQLQFETDLESGEMFDMQSSDDDD